MLHLDPSNSQGETSDPHDQSPTTTQGVGCHLWALASSPGSLPWNTRDLVSSRGTHQPAQGKSPSLLPERLWHHRQSWEGGQVDMTLWKERQPPSTCPHRFPVSDWQGSKIKTTIKPHLCVLTCTHSYTLESELGQSCCDHSNQNLNTPTAATPVLPDKEKKPASCRGRRGGNSPSLPGDPSSEVGQLSQLKALCQPHK